MKRPALGLIRLYKLAISPYMPGVCRFEPTCSDYTAQAIQRYGVLRGASMGARRLGRCHPGSAGGFDPVPENLKSN